MNKLKVVQHVKEKRRDHEFEKENGWNSRFTVLEKSPLNRRGNANANLLIKGNEERQPSSKLKIKTDLYAIQNYTTNNSRPSKSSQKKIIVTSANKHLRDPKSGVMPSINSGISVITDENYSQIKLLWDILGVTSSYRSTFETIALQLSPMFREGYFTHEINSLQNFNEKIQKLSKDISFREKILDLLRKFDKFVQIELLGKDAMVNKGQAFTHKVLDDIVKTIKDLRIISVNIVNHYVKIRKISSYDVLCGKYDIDKIYNYDRNYLLTMKNDTDFLATSSLANYFSFAPEGDPFLIALNSVNEQETGDNGVNNSCCERIPVAVEDTLVNQIRECQYIILQEMVYNEGNRTFFQAENSVMTGKSTSTKKVPPFYPTIGPTNASGLNIYNNSSMIPPTMKKHHELKPLMLHNNVNTVLSGAGSRPSKSPHYITASKVNRIQIGQVNENGNANVDNEIVLSPENVNKVLIPHSEKVATNTNINTNTNTNTNAYNFDNIIQSKASSKKADISIREKDLMKIDQIINRSIKQKKEMDSSINISTNQKEITGIVLPVFNSIAQNTISNENEKVAEKVVAMAMHEEDRNFSSVVDSKEASGRHKCEGEDKTQELLRKIDTMLKCSYSDDENNTMNNNHTQINQIKNETAKESQEAQKTEIQMKEISGFLFEIWSGDVTTIQSEYSDYFTKISNDLITAFKIQECLSFYLKGTYPKIIKIYSQPSKEFEGFATIHYDSNCAYNLRLVLSSISTLCYDKFPEVLSSFVLFCKESFPFEEMQLDFFYGLKDNQFVFFKNIENAITKKANFKWINLENDGERRKIKYKYFNANNNNNNNNNIQHDPRFVEGMRSPACIKSQSVLTITNEANTNTINSRKGELEDGEQEIIQFPIVCLFAELIHNYDYQINNPQFKKLSFEKLKKYSTEFVIPHVGNMEEIMDFIGSCFPQEERFKNLSEEIKKEEILSASIMKIPVRFENIVSTEYNGKLYNRLKFDKIEVFGLVGSEEKIHLIPCIGENFSIIICEIDDHSSSSSISYFSQFISDNTTAEANITEVFYQMYSKIIQQPICTKSTIYLPSFQVNRNQYISFPQSFAEIQITNDNQRYLISKLNQINDFCLGGYRQKGVYQFTLDEESDAIITKDFLMAVVNLEIACECQIPVVSAFIVRQRDFLKI